MAICAYFAEWLEPEKKMSELIIYDENEL
jgi:hypothetical protein